MSLFSTNTAISGVTLTFDLWSAESNKSSVGASEYSQSALSKLFKRFMRYHGNNIWLDKWMNERMFQWNSLKHYAFTDTVGWRKHKNKMKQMSNVVWQEAASPSCHGSAWIHLILTHLIHGFLGLAPHMASESVQPFSHSSPVCLTHRHTDVMHCTQAMRPKN